VGGGGHTTLWKVSIREVYAGKKIRRKSSSCVIRHGMERQFKCIKKGDLPEFLPPGLKKRFCFPGGERFASRKRVAPRSSAKKKVERSVIMSPHYCWGAENSAKKKESKNPHREGIFFPNDPAKRGKKK